VPWYFITLALMGAAVSISRKVPEYQRRVYFSPVDKQRVLDEERGTPLTPELVRDWLVFEVVQFVSAPFVALAAYYLVTPNSAGTSAAVGFLSGFSSEAILLLIRGAVERVSGVEATKAAGAAKTEAAKTEMAKAAADSVAKALSAAMQPKNPPPEDQS
jgi:hypothetical protein